MKKEDLNECLNVNALLSLLKDENAFLCQQKKMVDNLTGKVNEKTNKSINTIKLNSINKKARFLSKVYTTSGKDTNSLG